MPKAERRYPTLKPLGFQTINCTNTTAVGLNSTCDDATMIVFSVETTDCRLRDNSTAPQNATGVVFKKDLAPYLYFGSMSAVRFVRSGASGASKISVAAYKQVGDP